MKRFVLLIIVALLGGIGGALITAGLNNNADRAGYESRLEAAVNKVLPATVSLHPEESSPSIFDPLRRLAEGDGFHSAAGIAVRKGGFILTNAHVVEQFKNIFATTYDGKTYATKIVSIVSEFDVALISVPIDLPIVEPCQKDKVRVGRTVFSVGTPYDLPFSVSIGIISSLNRGRLNFSAYEDFLQTDAAINPGSSGGPLCDLDGRLVGINAAQFSLKSGSNGINFAIPVYLLQPIIDKMISKRTDVTTFLGVSARPENLDELRNSGLDNARGVVIYKVQKDSPAFKAGIRNGDIVTGIDGTPLYSPFELRALVLVRDPGDRIRFTILRDKKTVEIDIVLASTDPADPPSLAIPAFNALFEKPDDEMLGKLGAKFGAEIARVDYGGLAFRLGLDSKDIVLRVNGKAFSTLAEFRALILDALASGSIRIRYYSDALQMEKETSREF